MSEGFLRYGHGQRLPSLAHERRDVTAWPQRAVAATSPCAVRERDPVATAERGRTEAWVASDDVERRSDRRLLASRRAREPEQRTAGEKRGDQCTAGHVHTIGLVRLIAIGIAAGVFSALFGVGGGLIAVPLLILFTQLPERVATATSLAAIGITALAGVIVYAYRGEVDVGYAALVGLPAAGGAFFGTMLQQRITTRHLTYGFAVLLTGVGIWLLVA